MRILPSLIVVSIFLFASASTVVKYPTLYQVSARPWLYELSQEKGVTITALKDIPDDVLQSIKDQGFDYLWIMGVWKIGKYGIQHDRTKPSLVESYKKLLDDYTEEDAIGCPYSIAEYVCNPELCPGGDEDLKALREKLNGMGIKLMLDFVPNHSALDSPWVDKDITYYIRKPEGEPDDPELYYKNGIAYGNMEGMTDRWTDVAQLNYWEPKTIELMKQNLLHIAELADGIRCDVAWLVANKYFYRSWKKELDAYGYKQPTEEFWTVAIKELKEKYPNVILMAEVYGEPFKDLLEQGFDYTYEKTLLDKLIDGQIDGIKNWISYIREYQDHQSRFLENHDDNRAVAFFGGNVKKTIAAALATYTLPGMRFFFQDFYNGYQNKLEVHLRRSKKEAVSEEAKAFYGKFLPILNDDTLKNGEWSHKAINGGSSWKLLSWEWFNAETKNKKVIVVNFSDTPGEGTVVLSDVSGEGEVVVKDLLNDTEYKKDATELKTKGLTVTVNAWYAVILDYN